MRVAVPVVWPAVMVMVVDDSVKSLFSVAVLPLWRPMVTTVSVAAAALRVAVMMAVPAASATLALLTDRVTVGAGGV